MHSAEQAWQTSAHSFKAASASSEPLDNAEAASWQTSEQSLVNSMQRERSVTSSSPRHASKQMLQTAAQAFSCWYIWLFSILISDTLVKKISRNRGSGDALHGKSVEHCRFDS
jgi:hypothetical protein